MSFKITPQECLEIVLKEMRKRATERLGVEVTNVLLLFPEDPKQKHVRYLLKNACNVAGFRIKDGVIAFSRAEAIYQCYVSKNVHLGQA